ncbi:hypothetical protein EVAR_41166_1 [Eumeta japonica]|uniref:Uncharacterized protein n=1 Tax=Eumeta variegata TaxID=151549 RepID=A0A4C1YE67_EUMVA|nr:hypothetical protein EVAR_41166_1 [Eumeta japonica]
MERRCDYPLLYESFLAIKQLWLQHPLIVKGTFRDFNLTGRYKWMLQADLFIRRPPRCNARHNHSTVVRHIELPRTPPA